MAPNALRRVRVVVHGLVSVRWILVREVEDRRGEDEVVPRVQRRDVVRDGLVDRWPDTDAGALDPRTRRRSAPCTRTAGRSTRNARTHSPSVPASDRTGSAPMFISRRSRRPVRAMTPPRSGSRPTCIRAYTCPRCRRSAGRSYRSNVYASATSMPLVSMSLPLMMYDVDASSVRLVAPSGSMCGRRSLQSGVPIPAPPRRSYSRCTPASTWS